MSVVLLFSPSASHSSGNSITIVLALVVVVGWKRRENSEKNREKDKFLGRNDNKIQF
jgi:hypothetical protein